jgi:hypothetical protein
MSSERKAKVNNFLGTCMDLVLGVVNPVKKCLKVTEHLGVLILPKLFLFVSVKVLD